MERLDPDNKKSLLKIVLNSFIKAFVWLIIAFAAISSLWEKMTPMDLANHEPQISQSILATLDYPNSGSALTERSMPERIALDIKSMELYFDQFSDVQVRISGFHNQSWEERDIQQYRAALISGVEVADQYLEYLKKLNVDPALQNIWLAKYEKIKNIKAAYGYYLDYIHSKRSSDIEMGNHYLELANNTKDIQLLIEYFKKNNYPYALEQNGGVRYWYSKGRFLQE